MQRKILIRFDDICPTMDYTQWGRAVEILEKYNIKPLLGVIPDCRDPELQIESPHADFWQYMHDLQGKGYKIAMHGYHHVYDSKTRGIVNTSDLSEFAGHPYEVQFDKIAKGKQALHEHGVDTDVFFAPAHSYDENTLKALAANGFKYVSDGKSIKPFVRQGVVCIPCRSGGCPKINRGGYYTAVFHAHEWARPEKAAEYYALKALCENHHDNIVDFDTYAARKCGNNIVQLADEKIWLVWDYKLKPILREVYFKRRINQK